MHVEQITAPELQRLLDQDQALILLDVREKHEFDYASIAGSQLISIGEVQKCLGELERHQQIVVICHHGIRSQQVADYLVQNGFEKILNLQGGIDAWSCLCDPAVPRY